jgi:hypothetical protein
MAEKLFCDRCEKEISFSTQTTRRVKVLIELDRESEDREGNLETIQKLRNEVCDPCGKIIKAAIEFTLHPKGTK